MRGNLLRIAGYIAFFFASFMVATYLTFPYDDLKLAVIQEIEYPRDARGERRASGWNVDIAELEPSFVTGVDMTSVRVTKLAADLESAPSEIIIDEAHARISLLALLTGTVDVSFDLAMAGGTIEGELQRSDTTIAIKAALDSVNLRQISMVQSALGLPIEGVVSGNVDVTLGAESAQTNGSAQLTIDRLAIGNGRAELKPPGMTKGIALERLAAGKLEIEIKIEEGTAKIEKLHGRGPDLELDGSGTIRLAQPFSASRVNELLIRANVLEGYRNRNDKTRAIFELLEFAPQITAAKTPDGAYQFRVSGGLGNLRAVPAGRARMEGG